MADEPRAESELRELDRLRRSLAERQQLIVELEGELRELRGELERMRSSATGRVLRRLQRAARRVAPYGTRRQRLLHHGGSLVAAFSEGGVAAARAQWRRDRRTHVGRDYPDTPEGRRRQYAAWLRRHQPSAAALQARAEKAKAFRIRPLISVVMPVKDPAVSWLREAIDSVRTQTYDRWELCIVDDASANAEVRALLDDLAAQDERVHLARLEAGGGIAVATNRALAMATGEWVTFLDHDDRLAVHALLAFVEAMQGSPENDVWYSDEDKVLPEGGRGDPLFKPDWSPERLLSSNYITHPVLVRRDLVEQAGGLRTGYDGSQDHDLLLRVAERSRGVGHLAEVLYSWRMVRGSTAMSSDYKPLARETGRTAVADALQRRGREGRVGFGRHPGFYEVHYALIGNPSVAVVIPTRDNLELLSAAVASIEELTTYSNHRIVIVDNGSVRDDTREYLAGVPHTVIRLDAPFNFSRLVNAGVEAASGDYVVLFNNDVRVISPGWLESLLGHAQHPEVGAVGARLLYPDGSVQHDGIMIGGLHLAANLTFGWDGARETSAVTGACLMSRRDVWCELGGFDEAMAEAFNDVDYCLRARQAGYKVICTPLAELTHREGGSRGSRTPDSDRTAFVARWGGPADLRDPYVNLNVLWPDPLRLRLE